MISVSWYSATHLNKNWSSDQHCGLIALYLEYVPNKIGFKILCLQLCMVLYL